MCRVKRAFSLMMALFMVFSLLPLQVFAEDANNELESITGETLEKTIIDGVIIEYDAASSLQWYEDYQLWDYQYDPKGSTVTTTLKVYNKTGNSVLRFECEPYSCDSVIIGDEVISAKKILEVQPGASLAIQITISKSAGLSLSDFALTEIVQSGVLFQYDSTLGSITVDGSAMANGGRFEVPASGATLNATAKSDVTFLGWVDGSTGQILSSAASYLYKPTGQTSIKAAFAAPAAAAWFYAGRNNGYLFDDLNSAVSYANGQSSSYKTVTLAADGTLAKDTYDILSGVKVLIPHSASDVGAFGTTPDYSETKYGKQTVFRTLKVEAGAVINFNGSSRLNVNGYVYKNNGSFTGVCTDAYGCIDLGENAKINMNSKSALYCYGYIIGDGEVVANNGATVYEVFQMTGWRGGTITSAWQDKSGVTSFAFNDYAIQNIEADFVVNYGATAGVTATVSGELLGSLQTKTIDTTYIGKYESGSGLIQLESGASVRRSFTPASNRMEYIFNGNTHIASINLSVDLGFLLGDFSLNTASYILAIPYYWDFVVESGTVTLINDYKLLPGATLTVEEGAKAVIGTNSELYIYDTADYVGKGYASGNSVPVRYVASTGATASSLPKMNSGTPSGQIIVDGTLQIDGALYTTENGGTSVDKVLKGTGTVINNAASSTPVLDEFKYEDSEIVDYNINVIPVVGQLTGISEEESYNSMSAGDYIGLGDGWWYQHTVNFSGDLSQLKAYNGSWIEVGEATATGYSCTGGTLQFTLPFAYSATCTGATMTQAAASGSAVMAYSVPVSGAGMTIAVTEGSAEINNATIKYVSKADGAVVSTQQCYIPVGTDVSAYFADEACTTRATTFASGTTLYILVEARVGENEYYATLEDAIKNADTSGDVVTLLSNVQVNSSITVSAEQDIDIALGGHTITYSSNLLKINGTVDMDLQGGKIMNAQGAEVSALIVAPDGVLNLDMNGGAMTWSDYGVEGYSFSATSPAALIYCYSGGTANIDIAEGETISVVHPNAVTTYTLHAVINEGTMTINGGGTVTSDAYTNTSAAYVNSGSDTYNAAPPVVNRGTLTIRDAVVSSTNTNGSKNYAILNYDGGTLTLDGANISCASGYSVYNWGGIIASIKDSTITGTNGICNYNMDGFSHTATITEIVGATTIQGKGGHALSAHPETYIGVIGGEGSDVELIATVNAINGNEGYIRTLGDGVTIVASGYGVYTKGVVETVSLGGYYKTGNSVFYADTGTEENPYNASIGIPEGYHLSITAQMRTLRNGKTYGCTYLTTEVQNYPQILAGHLQMLPEITCQGPDLWQALTPEDGYFGASGWDSTNQPTVDSITIPVQPGDKISASSFGTTLKADGESSAGIRVTWFDENGILDSWSPGTTYSKYNTNGYITAPAGAIAVCIPVWVGEWEGNEAYLVKDCVYEYVDEDSDGFYTAVCSGCGTAHEGLLEHLQVPADAYCAGTNLWTTLKPELSRRTATAWTNDYYSITFPVEAGDKIWASSFQAAGANDHTANGIRVTWFHNNGKVTSFDSNAVYTEFSGNTDETTGLNYITAPEAAIAVCVTMWKNNSNSAVKILSKAHTYESVVTPPTCAQGFTTHTCTICEYSYVDSYVDGAGEHKFTNYVSNGDATAEADGTKTAVCDYGCGTESTVKDEGSSAVYAALAGKVISVMGDSISTLEGWIPTADGFNLEHYARYVLTAKTDTSYIVMAPEQTWWHQLIIGEFNAKLGINESWRSTEIGNIYDVEVNSGYEGTKACMASMTRIQNLGSNGTPDLILFYGGTNDITQRKNGRVLGSFAESMVPAEVDLTTDKWDTIIEAYVTALMRMHHFYPEAKIVCMFPTVTNNNSASVVAPYNAEFKKVCDYFIAKGYDIVYTDLLDSGVTTAHHVDGTHPNEEGMDLITAAVKKTLLTGCRDMVEGENTVYTVTHNLTNAKASLSYYKGLSQGKSFVETVTGENLTVTVMMGEEDVTETAYNGETGVISIDAVTGPVSIVAEGAYDPTQLYADRLKQIPENICSGVNLLEELGLDNGYFKDGAWDTSKYYSLTLAVEEGVKLWATSFQARNLNGATGTDGVRITWFNSDGSYTDYEAADVYSEFTANGYVTVPANAAAVSIIFRNNDADNAVYIMGLEHTADYVDNGDGTETMTCSICGNTETRLIGQYLAPYLLELPENIYNTTNLWPLLAHNTKYYMSSDTTETKQTYNASTWGVNGGVRSVTIPVGSDYRIYASSLTTSTGIRTTWFFADETALSWNPAQSRAYFLANTDADTGLHYIAAPEGAIAVNVAMWSESDANELYLLNLPKDPLTLNGLPSHLVDLPEPCYNDTNIWAELKAAGKLDGTYWNGSTWGTTGTVKSVTVRVNPGDRIVASSFGSTSGGNGIRVSWFLADGTVDSRPPRSGEGNVYTEFTQNGYLTAPENAIAVCVPMWKDEESCTFYNLDLPDNPLKAHNLLDHLVDLPDPCYNDTNIWAELAAAGKLDDEYWTASGWGTLEGAKSVTVRVSPGDKLTATSFGLSEGQEGIRVTWFFADGSTPKSMGKADTYAEFSENGYLTAPDNAVAVCVPMWAVRDTCEFYNLSLPKRPLSNVENYNGKVISIMGDSISTFAGYTPVADGFNLAHRNRYPQSNLSMDVNETWWMQVLTELDAKLGINDSWAGSRVNNTAETNSGDVGPDAAMASLTRIQNLGANGTPDVILVFGGTNDRGSTLGTFDASTAPTVENVDLTSYKWDNFVDAYVAMITRMKHYYPDAEIVALLPYMPNAASMNVEIKKICEYYGVAYTDLMDCGIQITTEHLPDNLHPNAAGFDYITDAVLDVLLNEVEMEAGEHTVYTITHNLTNVDASKHYYKGVSANLRFEETLSFKTAADVKIMMGESDVTATAYNAETGLISIDSVTGAIAITATAVKTNSDHVQPLPDPAYRDTNLWAKLEPEKEYYEEGGWNDAYYSITFPVNGGDKIWSTSLCDGTTNGSGNDGICITWFKGDEVLKRLPRTEADTEFKEFGYVTAPEGATAVNVPTWSTGITNVVYNLSLPTVYDGHLIELDRESICSGTDIWDLLKDEWENVYLDSAGKWTDMDGLRSITIPVSVGDQIWANVFGTTQTSAGTTKTGIRITWLSETGILETDYISAANGNLSADGTVTVPAGAVAVNLPVWDYKIENDMYILSLEHTPGEEATCTKPQTCTICGEVLTPATGVHIYDRQVTTETYFATGATCTHAATYYYSCACGEKGETTFEYGDALGHTMTPTAAKPATCTEDGNIAYWYCETCEKYFSDADGESELAEGAWVLTQSGHNFADEWTTDGTYHWHVCESGCGNIADEAAHIDVSEQDHNCDTCGYVMTTCADSEKTTTYTRVENTETHTVTVTCDVCGEQVGEVTTEDCADGEDDDNLCDLCGEEISVGTTVSGSAVSWNDSDDAIYMLYSNTTEDATIKAEWKVEEPVYTALYTATKGDITDTTVNSKTMKSQTFTFEGVEAGTYKLVILKPGKYVPKIVEITVGISPVDAGQQKLWLYGDVTYDGSVKANDAAQITRKVSGLGSAFDTGDEQMQADRLLAADIASDGLIKANDAAQITRYVSGLGSAFINFK